MRKVNDLRTTLYGQQGCHKDVRDVFCCLWMTTGYTSVTTHRAAKRPQDTPQGHPGWAYRPCRHSQMEFTDLYFSRGCQLIDKEILLT